MREIKFRVFFDGKMIGWHQKGKEFYLAPAINGISIIVFYRDRTSEPHMIGEGRLTSVMQFTGLKDKNGRDIYEGDVIQDIIVGMKSQIVFTDYANFGMRPINNQMSELHDMEYEIIDPAWTETTVEVIGNIHENPELLKA